MTDREDLAHLALDFLKDVAACAESQLGKNPQRVQRSEWMVRTGPGSMQSSVFERAVPDRGRASMEYQMHMLQDDNVASQRRLTEALVESGIERREVPYGYLLPLVNRWLRIENPFDLDDAVAGSVDEFLMAVIDRKVKTESSDVLTPLVLEVDAFAFQLGVCIRSVHESDLWELGDLESPMMLARYPSILRFMPSEDWKILEIALPQTMEDDLSMGPIETLRESVITALALAFSGHLQVIDLGRQRNYGLGSIGRLTSPMPTYLGRWGGSYVLNEEVADRLARLWPRLHGIMMSGHDDLRIAARRLVDGGGRYREDDAVIDYSIGLETLLLTGASSELSYRFSLRGATILSWNGGDRSRAFDELRDFYDVRSKIVHGGRLEPAQISSARSNGEKALRDIWWWFFDRGESVSKATLKIDESIESLTSSAAWLL